MQHEKWIDLHTHSTFSDGVNSPAQLVDIALEQNLSALALADHDCLDGFKELQEAGERKGVEVLSGVELSCEHRGRDLHILGYGVDVGDEPFLRMLRQFCQTREERGMKILEKLRDIGIDIAPEVVLAKAGEGALGRPHIAEALIEAGHAADFAEVFDKYIGEDCPAYVDKYKMSPAQAVKHIHASGGLAFVAHPGFYLEEADGFNELLEEPFDGIEVLHPQHNKETRARLLQMAKDRNMLVSGGSDYHGFKSRDAMGDPKVPYELLEMIKAKLNQGG